MCVKHSSCRLTYFSKNPTTAEAQCQGTYNAEHKMLTTEHCSTHTNLNLPLFSRRVCSQSNQWVFQTVFCLIKVLHLTITLDKWENSHYKIAIRDSQVFRNTVVHNFALNLQLSFISFIIIWSIQSLLHYSFFLKYQTRRKKIIYLSWFYSTL